MSWFHHKPLTPPRGRFEPADWLGALVAIVASAWVYHPLLENHFVSDDFLNLYRILNCGFWEYILTPHGGHTLVARNLVFYVCALAFGVEPYGYFWVVLLTHLLNVALLFLVIRRVTGSPHLAGLGATLWGTSPVHDGALGWYAVYGHVMAATMMLLIVRWLLAHADQPGRARHRLRACYAAAMIAMVSFGVGIGIALALPFVAALLAPAARHSARWGLPLSSLLVVVPVTYVGLFIINGYFFGEGIETPGLVAKYAIELWAMIVPNTIHLMSYGVLRLVATFWFDPAWVQTTTSYAVFAVCAAVTAIAAWRAPVALRRAMAASVLLALACYLCIAMGRVAFFQWLSSSFVAIQPRYHYAGLVPFTLLICSILASAGRAGGIPSVVKALGLVAALAAIAAGYRNSEFAVDHHVEGRAQVDEVMTSVMASVGAAEIGSDVYIPNRSFAGFFMLPPTVFPGWAAIFAIYHPTNVVEGRHVYFVDKRLGVLIASAKGKRSSRLIVPPPSKGE